MRMTIESPRSCPPGEAVPVTAGSREREVEAALPPIAPQEQRIALEAGF